jgi:hypothetical protein
MRFCHRGVNAVPGTRAHVDCEMRCFASDIERLRPEFRCCLIQNAGNYQLSNFSRVVRLSIRFRPRRSMDLRYSTTRSSSPLPTGRKGLQGLDHSWSQH